MVIASHVIFTTYGFWLPNDPRGSWSDWVRSWDLRRYGRATKTDERNSVAGRMHNQALRRQAKLSLKFPPVRFNGLQALSIAAGFRRAMDESGYRVLACSILPEHVHMVIERHQLPAERIVGHLKAWATQQLSADGRHPFAGIEGAPSVWGHRAWKVFLDCDADVERAVRYVQHNPIKDGKKAQRWSFVRCEESAPQAGPLNNRHV
jgi:REP-associated tyrosine transposase